MFVDWKNSLSIDDVTKIVMGLGSKAPRTTGTSDTLIFQTVCHNGQTDRKSYKLYYYHSSKMFRCYTACSESFDIYSLIEKVFSLRGITMDFYQSIQYITSVMYPDKNSFMILPSGENVEAEDEQIDNSNIVLEEYKTNILNNLPQFNILDWNKEGIPYETLKKFNIRYYSPSSKIVIPHYDIDNRLVGIRGRSCILQDVEEYGKYMPLITSKDTMFNHPLGMNLYGIHLNKDNISRKKIAILFEGEKSVMIADNYMSKNITLAVCGMSITKQQANILLDLGVEEVVIAFDKQYHKYGDSEYFSWEKKVFSAAEKFEKKCKVSVMYDKGHTLKYKDSPADKNKNAFARMYREREVVFEKEERKDEI